MSGDMLTWANGSSVINNHAPIRKLVHNTVDLALAYAAELEPDLALSFDTLSDKTALVLRAFVAAMYQDGHSYGEIEDIRDAMKHYFEDKFRCIGIYWQFLPDECEATIDNEGLDKDEERGEWIGNPVFDTAFVSMMQELKDQDERSEGARQAKRRTAIGYEDVTKLMRYFQKPETIKAQGLARCLFFQAFAATAFTLWLTFDDVLKLKRGDIQSRWSDSNGPTWLNFSVPFRNSSPIDPTQANVYEIYPQMEEPDVCCKSHLFAWIQQLELKKGRPLQADDYLFPDFANNDQIQREQPFLVTQVSDQLNKYAADAGIMGHRYNRLDTHCFRRGGAQHRLLHDHDQWPLNAIKWWGGWSEREPAEKIIEYLMDDYQYETGFGDMLSPHKSKTRRKSRTARLPVDMMMTRETFKSTIRAMESKHATALAKIEKEVQELRQQNMEFHRESIEWRSAISLQLEKVVQMLVSRVPTDQVHRPVQRSAEVAPEQPPQRRSIHPSPSEPLQRKHPQQHPARPSDLPCQSTPQKRPQGHFSKPKRQTTRNIPAISHWKEAILQWDQGDPDNGLNVPLSDWTVAMRRKHATYYDRKVVAKEFESFGRSEAKMRKVYGSSMGKFTMLTKAIRSRHKQQKQGVGVWQKVEQEASEEEEEKEEEQQQEGTDDDTEERPKDTWPKVPMVRDWKQALRQWEIGDLARGLEPISKWPLEWQRSSHTQASYLRRKAIAEEYEYCGRDEHQMRRLHGRAMERLDHLAASIKRQKRLRQQKKERAVLDEEHVEEEVRDELVDELEDGELEDEEEPLVKKRKVVTFDDQDSFKTNKP
ncbi:hypothetical protein MVEG_01224 [Podila verticillata NRRL 6337]|nr:hypothetical protein MVEG_01224 [Podila verticillata NRRL 6337]